jgi:hypothetical protein
MAYVEEDNAAGRTEWLVGRYLLEEFNGENALWLDLDAFAPKFDFRMDRAVEAERLGFGVEGRNGRMVAHLLAHDSVLPRN